MFDLGKLGDMTKLAAEAKKVQEEQNRFQREQLAMAKNHEELLKKILQQLVEIKELLKK